MRSTGYSDVCVLENFSTNNMNDSFDLDFNEFNRVILTNIEEDLNTEKANTSDCSLLESLCGKWNNDNELDDSNEFNQKFQKLKKLNNRKKKQKSKFSQKKLNEDIKFSPDVFLKSDFKTDQKKSTNELQRWSLCSAKTSASSKRNSGEFEITSSKKLEFTKIDYAFDTTTFNFQNIFNGKQTEIKKDPFECFIEEIPAKKSQRNHLDDLKNRINLENILRQKDSRTTLMIRHIPNKYKLATILEDIDKYFKGKYDLLYLPLDYNNNCNLGFAFINFVDPLHILYFYNVFRGKKWPRFNSEKICELAYAKFQGKKELINHFEKGSIMLFDSQDKRPLILDTPKPLPMVELPVKFIDAFLVLYPYASYEVLVDVFVIYSLGSN